MDNGPTSSRIFGRTYRHGYLLATLLLMIILPPFLTEWRLSVGVLEITLFLSIVSGAYVSTTGRKSRGVVLAIACAAIITRSGWLIWMSDPWLYCFLVTYIVLFSAVAVVLFRSLFQRDQRVTADTLFAAFSIYLVLGLLWTVLYSLLEAAQPGSFHFGTTAAGDSERFDRFIGFSFTTLTTLGYGNIAPQTPKADALTTMQAIIGQLYVAVVIARLVAIQITQGATASKDADD